MNDFGKAFKDAGFKFPEDDENAIKVPPVLLGAEAQKQTFPHTIWPSQIPGLPPIGLRMNNFLQFTSNSRNRFNTLAGPNGTPQFIPGSDFQTGLFSIFTAGNFGDNISFWVDDDISVSGDNSAGSLGDAYIKFGNVSRLLKMRKDSLSFRVGQFELDLPFTQARTHNLSGYDIYQEANIGSVNPEARQQFVGNQFTLGGAAQGAEVSGGHLYGGYHYSFAVFNQNTSGIPQSGNASNFVPSPAGFASDSNTKNIYGRISYRFNLERNPESRKSVQAAGATGPRDHTYLNVGGFFVRGKSQQTLVAEDSTPLYANELFYRAGGDFSFNYRGFNLYGLFLRGHDDNLLPVDDSGALIPLPLEMGSPAAVKFVPGVPATFSGGFVQADYLVLPWIMLIGRWDGVNSTADRLNGLVQAEGTAYFAAYNSTRNRYTPGIQFLIRPNIKASMEYSFHPRQSLSVTTDASGRQTAADPFRVHTVLVATEFVF